MEYVQIATKKGKNMEEEINPINLKAGLQFDFIVPELNFLKF